jgi:chromosome segregation protein
MELTKLEVKGFKSFGDKVVINFDKGITGIVGPNGCGKSNIVDAIRWVLGEQKIKTLRSEKMENIIFNGTKNRKALQLAEASITFENTKNILPTDYSSVTITRRYFRSGDSEYLLNGVPCRLKDITNLFLDTGIASHSYAIIELAMVDEILNDKDNSRRHLFEEAAGISKFRVRKRETMRKLEATDLDLERVEDLIYEIQKNMRSLERQARQTKRYFKIKEEYKDLSILLARKTVALQKEQLENINVLTAKENDKKLSLSKKVSEKEAAIENAKKELLEKEKDLSQKQKALNEFVAKIRQFESDKKIKNEKLRFLNDKSLNLKDQIEQDIKSNERASFSIQSLKQEKQSAETTLKELETKVKGLQDEHLEEKKRTQMLRDEVDSMNEVYKVKHEEVFQYNKEFEIKEIQLNTLKQELEKTTSDTTEQSESLVEFDKKIKEIQTEIGSKSKYLNSLKKGESQIEERIESTDKLIEKIKDELSSTNRILDSKQNEYNLTKSLVDNLEGFPEAIRFLKAQKSWGKKAPLLSDILTTEEKYRATIENYLEPFMNYYVVDTEADAFKAVNLLSEASKGRAHFFILDSFEKFTPSPIKIFDNATPATEIVEYDLKYQKLVSYILNNVYLISQVSGDFPKDEEAIFMAANGKFTKKRFSISGGSVGLFEGKRIGRAKNLEKLDRDIKRLNKKHQDIKNKLNEELKALVKLKGSTKKDKIEILQTEINQLNESLISLKTREEQYSQLLSSQSTKKENILERIEELKNDLEKLSPITEKGKIDLEILGEKILSLQNELKNQQEMFSLKSTAYNDENILFHQQKNKINSIDQEINFKSIAFENSKERINKNQHSLELNEKEIKELLSSEENSEDVILEMYEEKETLEKILNESEKEYYSARGQIDEIENQVRELQHSRENIDTIIIELKDKLNEIKLQLNSIKERLSVEFQVSLDEILKEPDTEEDDFQETEESLREKVDLIKNKLEKIGPINPMAMEAYDEVKKRNDFITEQREDLVQAKESLRATIDEIDLAARANFMEAFEKIKENFINVFRTLFGEEDDCDLILTNIEDPLSSNIDIIAKPKGKKPLTINQLSGGEKTLTATSLLFAIYLMKPAPFCIFDEVDAPLDDANLDKFNLIIRKFSKDSQFIIVTHNKRTMISTDVIYGITMVEQGISKVVPVDLRELEV